MNNKMPISEYRKKARASLENQWESMLGLFSYPYCSQASYRIFLTVSVLLRKKACSKTY